MRAKELLESVLTEATTVLAIIFGPIRPSGGYVGGANDNKVIAKIGSIIGDDAAVRYGRRNPTTRNRIQGWMHKGYTIFVRNQRDQFVFYGAKPVKLNQQAINVYGLTPGTPVFWYRRSGNPVALHGVWTTAAAFGVT